MTREDELMARIEQGDNDAAGELVTMFYDDILRYCLWHMPSRVLAEEAVQETFLKVIRYFDRYIHKGRFKAFLYQVAANTCIDLQRKYCRLEVSLENLSVEMAYTEQGFEAVQEEIGLKMLISALPKDLQEIVLLRFGQDLTIREIALAVDLPLRTVQSRLRSALKRLKKDWEKGGKLS